MKHITQATENRLNEMYNYIFGENGENWEQYTNVRYMPRVYGEAIALYEMLNMKKCRLGWDGATVSEMKKYGELVDNHMSFSNIKKRYFETAVYAMKYHYEKGKYAKFSVYYVNTLDLDSGYIDGFNEIVKFVYNRFCAYVKTTVDPVTYYQDCIFEYVKNLPRWAKEAFEICGMLTEWEELERKFAEFEQEQQEETATTESGNQANTETNTYEHALKMAMYAAECGDGVQAIYHKDGKFKAGLKSDREYAEKNGWQYFHTVWETVPEEERTRAEKWEEIKEARKKSLFWAKRMCYKSADYRPEWKEEYEKAKKHVEEVKTKYEETEPEEPVQEANTKSGTVLGKSDWNGKIARLKAVVSYFKSHNMHWEANKAYKHNWKFYREHTAEECIKIIHEECTQKTGIQI